MLRDEAVKRKRPSSSVLHHALPPEQAIISGRTPVFRNIAISHMTIDRARIAIDVAGLPEMPILGLRISDLIFPLRRVN